MTTGIFLERFLLLFLGVLWALYLLGVPTGYIAGAAALMLSVGAGLSLLRHRRLDSRHR